MCALIIFVSGGCGFVSCVMSMLRAAQEEGLLSHQAVLKYVGERFRLKAELPPWTSDEDVTRHLLRWVVYGSYIHTYVCMQVLCLRTELLKTSIPNPCNSPGKALKHYVVSMDVVSMYVVSMYVGSNVCSFYVCSFYVCRF